MIATTCLRTLFVLLISASIASCGSSSSKGGGPTNNPTPPESCAAANIVDIQVPSSNNFGPLQYASDVNCFKFTLTTANTISISAYGPTSITGSLLSSTHGKLYTSSGILIEENDNNGIQGHFFIERVLSAGTYYVDVTTPTTAGTYYTLNVALPYSNDGTCPVNRAHATSSTIPFVITGFQLDNSQDVDCFKFILTTESAIVISTTGSTNTFGKLYDYNGTLLESNADSGIDTNFLIERTLSSGTYYVEVTSQTVGGSYDLNFDRVFPDTGCPAIVISSILYTSTGLQLENSQDRDCFRFTLDAQRTVDISTAGLTDTIGRLYNSSGSLLRSNDNSGSSRNFLIGRTLSAGTYYLDVTTKTITGGSYILNLVPSFPNTDCPATDISTSYTSNSLQLDSSQDRDCFEFTLTTEGTIAISTIGSTNTFGRLYASNGGLIEFDDDRGSGRNFFIRRILSAGTYYVDVATRTNTGGSYTLRVSTPCVSPASISPYILYSSSFRLRDSGDRDCFEFRLRNRHTIAISTTGSTDTFGGLYDYRGRVIELDDYDGSSRFFIERTLSAGTYYADVATRTSAGGSYTLNLKLVLPDPDCPATDISIPYRSAVLQLNPLNNRACFRFTLTTGRTVSISTRDFDIPDLLDTSGSLYASSGSRLMFRSGNGSGFSISRTLSPGTYYIGVMLEEEGASGSYTLRVDFL